MISAAEYAAGLRDMADFIETHPDLTPTLGAYLISASVSDDDFLAKCRQLEQGTMSDSGDHVILARYFGPHRIVVAGDKHETAAA